ncbi:phage repressor protein CI [Yersinia enterocolitica]
MTNYTSDNVFAPKRGGRSAIQRVIKAYGLNKRTELSEKTGISIATITTWWKRDFYPANLLIGCALETGVSLRWLSLGEGPMYDDAKGEITSVARYKIINGKLFEDGYLVLDNSLLSVGMARPKVIISDGVTNLVDCSFEDISDGTWLVEIEHKASIRNLELIPVSKVRVSSNELKMPFECALADITVLARVDSVLQKM